MWQTFAPLPTARHGLTAQVIEDRLFVSGDGPTPFLSVSDANEFFSLKASGDVDCNGLTNAVDAALILQFVASLIQELPCPQNADMDGDGTVYAIDAVLVLQLTAGLLA